MTATQLETLVQQIVDRSTATTIGRHVDRIAEGIIEEILKERRGEFTALVTAAIQRALANLSAPGRALTAPVVVDDWDGPAEVLTEEGGWSLRPIPPDVVLAPGYALEFNITLNPEHLTGTPRKARYRIRPMPGWHAWYLRWRYPA